MRPLYLLLAASFAAFLARPCNAGIDVDLFGHNPASGVVIHHNGPRLRMTWPMAEGEHGVLILQLSDKEPLIEELGIAKTADGPTSPLLRKVNPMTCLTVGIRDLSTQGWNAFFDNPPQRPHATFVAVLQAKKVRAHSQGRHSTLILDGLTAGPFHGELRFTVYPGCRLVHTEAVVRTEKDACAILYDAGLTSAKPDWKAIAWLDTDDKLQRVSVTPQEVEGVKSLRNAVLRGPTPSAQEFVR